MDLNYMTRDQLKAEAKKRGLTKYHSWSGAKLIKEITKIDLENGSISNPADETNNESAQEPASETTSESSNSLSPQAQKWKEYFVKTNTSAAAFLQRYPNHKFKIFISELL